MIFLGFFISPFSILFGVNVGCIELESPSNGEVLPTISQIRFEWEDTTSVSGTYDLHLYDEHGFDTLISDVSSRFWVDGSRVLEGEETYFWEILKSGVSSCEIFEFTVPDPCIKPLLYDDEQISYFYDFETDDVLDEFILSTADSLAKIVNEGTNKVVMLVQPIGRKRSELTFKTLQDQKDHRNHFNREMYYSYKMMIPKPFESKGEERLINQWHSQPQFDCGEDWGFEGPPPVAVLVLGDTLRLKLRWPSSLEEENITYGDYLIPYGEWIDVMIHIKWSIEDDGFAVMYVDGEPITPFNGEDHRVYAKTLKNRTGNYFKFGLYLNPPKQSSDTIYFDDFGVNVPTSHVTSIKSTKSTSLVYPNPVNKYLFIKCIDFERATLFSLDGHIISENLSQKIDMTGYQSGLFIIEVKTKYGVHLFKIIKK